jgi:hypothetical protein
MLIPPLVFPGTARSNFGYHRGARKLTGDNHAITINIGYPYSLRSLDFVKEGSDNGQGSELYQYSPSDCCVSIQY